MTGGTKSHAPAQSHSAAQSHAPAHAPPPSAELDFTALLGCLVVTFSVIGLGYVAQRTGFFDRNTKAGLGQFVGKVALPALRVFYLYPSPLTSSAHAPFSLAVTVTTTL